MNIATSETELIKHQALTAKSQPEGQRVAIEHYDFHPASGDHIAEISAGLRAHNKYIAPKFFYDHLGSELFTEITKTEAYYPTRTEKAIIEDNIAEISQLFAPNTTCLNQAAGAAPRPNIYSNESRHSRPC